MQNATVGPPPGGPTLLFCWLNHLLPLVPWARWRPSGSRQPLLLLRLVKLPQMAPDPNTLLFTASGDQGLFESDRCLLALPQ